jgi:Heterokaryon incompatibility protein (HET)
MSDNPIFPDESNLCRLNNAAAQRIYTPLGDDIRLVRLHCASERNSPVICSLKTSTRDNAASYEALSYVWGSEEHPRAIHLDELIFYVTQNLHIALTALRSTNHDRLIWIDALCINQLDTTERNHQVRLMTETYSGAERTMVWLGEGDETVNRFFQHLTAFSRSNPDSDFIERGISPYEAMYGCDESLSVAGLPYWERVWVVQELKHSKVATFVYGTHVVPFSQFVAYWKWVTGGSSALLWERSLDMLVRMKITLARQLVRLEDLQPGSALRGLHVDLSTWLRHFCPLRQCSDPRDKVFGFYGCFPADVRSLITVDYRKHISEVFTDITEAIIQTSGHLEFLSEVEVRSRIDATLTALPSWVPNFCGQNTTMTPFSNEKELSAHTKPPAFNTFACGGRILHVRGIYIGTYERSSGVYDLPDDQLPETSTHASVLKHFIHCKHVLGASDEEAERLVYAFRGPRGDRDTSDATRPLLECESDMTNLAGTQSRSFSKGISQEELMYLVIIHRQRCVFAMTNDGCDSSPIVPSIGISRREFGIGPRDMQEGDKIYQIFGCSYPIVVRKTQENWVFIGLAFIRRHERRLVEDPSVIDPTSIEDIYLD